MGKIIDSFLKMKNSALHFPRLSFISAFPEAVDLTFAIARFRPSIFYDNSILNIGDEIA
jgi:hypothetical protein